LASALGGTSHLIHYLGFKRPFHAPIKYGIQLLETFHRLRRDQTELILVASPPVFAALTVWAYCRLHGARYVIDAHTGVFDDPRWTWLLPLSRFLARGAVANIVTNRHLADQVGAWGAKALIIPDVPVQFAAVPPARLGAGVHVAVVNTFSQDEPLEEILAAAARLPDVRFHVTGDPGHARRACPAQLPTNARYTGWLSDEDYAALLFASDAVMCLTTHDHTMQRGAYEAMAAGKPLITSQWQLLRETFDEGTVHVPAVAAQIADAVLWTMKERSSLAEGMLRLRRRRLAAFESHIASLREAVATDAQERTHPDQRCTR
jgi:glycosyltransferase involved in cell wall biosynthesis